MSTQKILIVDDARSVRTLLGGSLREAGYQVFCAEDGEVGLIEFRAHQPQVVITDLAMPKMDGLTFLKALNLGTAYSKAAIVLTGRGTDQAVEKCFQLGVQSFLRKPVGMYEVVGLVKRSFEMIENGLALQKVIKQLESTNHFLRLTVDALAEGVIALDSGFRVKMASAEACRILNMEEGDVLGKMASSLLGAPIAGPFGELVNCANNQKNAFGLSTRVLCPSGPIVPVSLSVVSLASPDTSAGWLLILKDRREEERRFRESRKGNSFGGLVGSDVSMLQVFDKIENTAKSNATVLITGETGTGKELAAREIHGRGIRAQQPFLAVNCAAIAGDLLASELFGHEKGSFTGAFQAKPGRFELANGGTLFLDEIGEIPLAFQGKLLRAIEEHCFERVGGTRQIHVDIRLITATNRNLKDMVEQKCFREDLFYRLHVVPIHMPPLRERVQDIPLLVTHFIRDFNEREGRLIERISAEALLLLLEYLWPGNVRELIHAVEYAFTLSKNSVLQVSHFPDLVDQTRQKNTADVKSEKEMILWALQQVNFNKTKAAALLGINRTTLYRKEKKYNIH